MSSPLKAIGNFFSGGGSGTTAPIIMPIAAPAAAAPPPPATTVPVTNPGTNKPAGGTSFLSAVAPAASAANQGNKTLLGQ